MSEDYDKNKKHVQQCANINNELIDVKTKLKSIIELNTEEICELIIINNDINNSLNAIKTIIEEQLT